MDCLKYLGNMSFLLEINGTSCAINISGRSRFSHPLLRRCDLIFITSEEAANFDVGVVERLHGRTYAAVVAPSHILAKLRVADKFKVDVHPGEKFSLRGLDIQVCKSVRPQSACPVGFVISSSKWKVYYSGSTYAFVGMGSIRCDIAILPVAGGQCMDAFAAANACRDLSPRYAIPIAYEKEADANIREFVEGLPAGVKPIVLKAGAEARLKK